jgi:hypothetical protein
MLCKKLLVSAVMTIAVSSQIANAEIKSDAGIELNAGQSIAATAPAFSLPSGTGAGSYEWLLRDGGLRSLAISQYEARTPRDLDSWLMLLVGGGLVVLQLRRKQKTLPQRPMIESENKLFWG